jgi:hypothetical protein
VRSLKGLCQRLLDCSQKLVDGKRLLQQSTDGDHPESRCGPDMNSTRLSLTDASNEIDSACPWHDDVGEQQIRERAHRADAIVCLLGVGCRLDLVAGRDNARTTSSRMPSLSSTTVRSKRVEPAPQIVRLDCKTRGNSLVVGK